MLMTFPYPTISSWFAQNGDFPENHEPPEVSDFEEGWDEIDLPPGYRWATEDETEVGMEISGALMVTRTFDSTGKRYTDGEADLAVPVGTDIDYEPCCRLVTQRLGGGDHEWGCPNY